MLCFPIARFRAWLVSLTAVCGLALGASACGDSGRDEQTRHAFLDENDELPPTLSALGLYPDVEDRDRHHPETTRYVPRYPLWSNGGAKDRLLYLPEGEQVDTSDPAHWRFPDGTMFFKTFSFEDEDGMLRPVETRLLYNIEGEWAYALYLWKADATDAELTDMKLTHPVTVYDDGDAFEHVVPSRRDCDKCHESNENFVIGFDELRLNDALPGEAETQLQALHAAGVLSDVRDDPDTIENDDATTREVLGYLQGNCAHCHNGREGPSNAYDLRHTAALDNLIDQRVTTEGLGGVRVVPGDPEASVLYLALIRDESDPELRPMPPVGVQKIDEAAVDLIRGWIEGL